MIPVPQVLVDPPSSRPKVRQVWTPAEDQLLARAVQRETPPSGSISWCRVATHLPGRNNKDCRKRWHYSIAHDIRKGTWTREEDRRLREAVIIHGTRWSKIAEVVGTRNGDQCWKRWYDCLDPQIDKSPWTPEEDAKLLRTVASLGRNWTGIVNNHFPKRTSLAAKNRYSILQRKQELRSHSRGSSSRSLPKSSIRTSTGFQNSTSTHGTSLESRDNSINNAIFHPMVSSKSDYYDPSLYSEHQHYPIQGYWSTAASLPSGPSTPESAHADSVDWSCWGMNSPDNSEVSCELDNGSYLSPGPVPIHSPHSDYNLVGGPFFDPMSGISTPSIHTASPSTSSYSPVYTINGTGVISEEDYVANIHYMVPTYKSL